MAAKKEKSDHSPEILALYDALVNSIPGLERKGAAMPYTSLNGHMFSYINNDDGMLALRLPKDVLGEFLEKYNTQLCVSYGTVMKEYAVVPHELLKNTAELLPYFAKSYEYIGSLKPKPTAKKK